MNTSELLDRARQRQKVSDYGLCKLLGVGTSTISNYRVGRSHPDERMARKLAVLAGEDPLQVIAWMQAERARDEESRATWEQIAERLGGAAAALLVCVSVTSSPDAGAQISQAQQQLGNAAGGGLYIMSTRLRIWLRRALSAIQRMTPRPAGLCLA